MALGRSFAQMSNKKIQHQKAILKSIQVYPNTYKHTRYIRSTRLRPGGGTPARPRAAGPGPARAARGYLVYIWICLDTFRVYFFAIFFGMVTPQGPIWPKATWTLQCYSVL